MLWEQYNRLCSYSHLIDRLWYIKGIESEQPFIRWISKQLLVFYEKSWIKIIQKKKNEFALQHTENLPKNQILVVLKVFITLLC